MKFPTLYTAFAISLATLLSACGAGDPDALAASTAVTAEAGAVTTVPSTASRAAQAATVTNVMTATAGTPQASSAAPAPASPAAASPVAAVSSTMPAPDCAADGCSGPRIIDGNAEAYRYAAMQRAALEAASS